MPLVRALFIFLKIAARKNGLPDLPVYVCKVKKING